MTVAALLFADSFPVAITDSLISTKRSPNAPSFAAITTPLRSNESRSGIDGFKPSGLALKQWVAGQRMLLLYAGVIGDAQQLLDFIQLKTVIVDYSDAIHADVGDFIATNLLQVSFILVQHGENGAHSYFSYGARDEMTPLFGRVVTIGSGKTPLLEIFAKAPAAELPDPAEMPVDHIETTVVNALQAVAVLSRDYMDDQSKMADKSTGGLFNVAYFPELYGFMTEAEVPVLVVSGICQILVELRGEAAVITRISVSRQIFAAERMEVLLFEGELDTLADSTTISIDAPQLQSITIAKTRDESKVDEFSPKEDFGIHQVIVYVERTERCRHGGRPRTHHVYWCRGEPLVSVEQKDTGIALKLVQPLMAKVIDAVDGAGSCPTCEKTALLRQTLIAENLHLLIDPLLQMENQQPIEGLLDALVQDQKLLHWWLGHAQVDIKNMPTWPTRVQDERG
jgi:hypothetical protein